MATHTITALFDRYEDAANAVSRVEAAGVPHDAVSIVANDQAGRHSSSLAGERTADDASTGAGTGATLGTVLGGGAGLLAGLGMLAIPGIGPVVAAGWLIATLTGAGIGAAVGGLTGSLTGAGISEADAHTYAEGVRRGGTLVTVRSEDALTSKVAAILEEHGSIDIDERAQGWRAEGWVAPTVATAAAAPVAGMGASTTKGVATAGTEAIPIVEERLNVGKRATEGGRVRIHSYVSETPISEQVTLRDETVHVDRRTADRPVTANDASLFTDRTVEATTMREQAVVSKEARVVGEVGLRKEVTERVETVSDKVRRTEVEVEDERGQVTRTGSTDRKPV